MLGEGKVVKFKNGKKIGVICKDKTFRTFKTEKRHLFRIYNGWSINEEIVKELKDIGIEWIEVQAYDTKIIYRTKLANFLGGLAIHYRNPKKEKDFQLVLPLRFWQRFPMKNKRAKKW